MKRRLVKVSALLIAAVLLGGCGANTENTAAEDLTADSQQTKQESSENQVISEEKTKDTGSTEDLEMNKSGLIEETVLYEEDGLKITASEIEYTSRSAELTLEIENNSEKDLRVTSSTIGYSCNAVNGYMVSDGYISSDISAGKKATETAKFSYEDLFVYGITEIADIEMGFTISDDDYNYIYTEPAKIETSLAATHDYDTDTYPQGIFRLFKMEGYDYQLVYEGNDCLYDQGGIRMLSHLVISNYDGHMILLMEFENDNDKMLYVGAENISINGLRVTSGTWTSEAINGKHKGLLTLDIGDVLDKDSCDIFGIKEIREIGMDITVNKHDGTEMELPVHVSVKLADGAAFDPSGDEIYNANGIRLVNMGSYQEEDDYTPNIHIFMVAENEGSEEITIDDEYNSFSVNDCMTGCYFYSRTLAPGEIVLMNIEIPYYNFDDAKIESLEDITKAEITLEIKNKNYKTIDEPVITFELDSKTE